MAVLVRKDLQNPELCEEVRQMAGTRFADPIALDTWVRGHFHYRPEDREVLRTPTWMWMQWNEHGYFDGDCDDSSIMFAFILKCLGFPMVRFVAIRYDPTHGAFEHVFVEVFYAGQWRIFDQTVSPGTDYKAIERMVESL